MRQVVPVRGLLKAEYVFRPTQVLRRLAFALRGPDRPAVAQLAWGMPIEVDPRECVGRAVFSLGVYDLPLVEVLWRLTSPGEVAADVGANAGAIAAALVARVGRAGRVWAFEAHPVLAQRLRSNAERWRSVGTVEVVNAAVSSAPGTVTLSVPARFAENSGLARVVEPGTTSCEGERLTVSSITLDDHFAAERPPDVLKIDVEGHERAVLDGAARLLSTGATRDCVYEEHRGYPTDVSALLEGRGFRVFRIERGLRRPCLVTPTTPTTRGRWEATSYLATHAPDRALQLMEPFGWACLRGRPAQHR